MCPNKDDKSVFKVGTSFVTTNNREAGTPCFTLRGQQVFRIDTHLGAVIVKRNLGFVLHSEALQASA